MGIDPLFDPLTPWEVSSSLTKRRYPLTCPCTVGDVHTPSKRREIFPFLQ